MSGSDYDLLHFTSLDCIELSVIFAVAVVSLQSAGKIEFSTVSPRGVFHVLITNERNKVFCLFSV